MSLLKVENVSISYSDYLKPAVDNVSFTVEAGEIIGIIGESGSGKSTLGYAITGLLPENAKILQGKIEIADENALDKNKHVNHDVKMILQDPLTRFCPVFRMQELFYDVLKTTNIIPAKERNIRIINALEKVGIRNPQKILISYPHELSGGMLQRVMIAIISLCESKVIIADEPTSAIDAILKKQILILLKDLSQMDNKPAIVLVTHDIDVVTQICDKVIVMKEGMIVERGSIEKVLNNPENQYTRLLCKAAKRFK